MGFVDYNTLGNFNAEVNSSLPAFAAEDLYSLSSRQFAAATVDSANVTNYDPDTWSRFSLGSPTLIHNDGGLIRTRSDQGWHFTNAADSGKTQTVKIYDKNKSNAVTFTLAPGETLARGGQWSTATVIPAGGSLHVDGIVTKIPWMHGWKSTEDADGVKFSHAGDGLNHNYFIGLEPATTWVDPAGGDNGTNGDNGDNGDNGGNGGNGNGETEEGTNWMLYGGAFALLAVGGFMAVKMVKKKSKK